MNLRFSGILLIFVLFNEVTADYLEDRFELSNEETVECSGKSDELSDSSIKFDETEKYRLVWDEKVEDLVFIKGDSSIRLEVADNEGIKKAASHALGLEGNFFAQKEDLNPDYRVITLKDKKILVFVRSLVIRLNADLSKDKSFGKDGIVEQGSNVWHGRNLFDSSYLEQSDGKILINSLGCYPCLLRYLDDGTPDKSFGKDGIVRLKVLNLSDAGTDDNLEMITVLVVRPSGVKIVAFCMYADRMEYDHPKEGFCIIRFNEDGSKDDSFGSNGCVTEFAKDSKYLLQTANTMKDGSVGCTVADIDQEKLVEFSYSNKGKKKGWLSWFSIFS